MTINLKEVAEYVAALNGMSKVAAERAVKDAFAYVKSSVAEGEEVTIDKFGKFSPEVRAAREGRNPATGAAMSIGEKKVVKFKPAKDFKDVVAG